MLDSFALAAIAGAVAPVLWFLWWIVADIAERGRARRPAAVVTVRRTAASAGANRYARAA